MLQWLYELMLTGTKMYSKHMWVARVVNIPHPTFG